MRAQVQVLGLGDPHGARQSLLRRRQDIIDLANQRDKVLIGLGGGCRDIECMCWSTRGAALCW
jgi:hydroxymethylglutaryl-CoA reductase